MKINHKINPFLRNTLVYSIGTLGSKAIIFMLVPLFSYFFTKSELGIYDLIMSIVTLCVPFVGLQISNATYRWLLDSAKDNIVEKKSYVTNSVLVIFLGVLAFLLLIGILSIFIKNEYYTYLILLVIVSSYLPLFQFFLRGLGKIRLFSIAGILNAALIFILNTILIFFDFSVKGLFAATIIANFLSIAFIIIKGDFFKYISFKLIDRTLIKKMLRFSIPLIPNSASWWLINSADKFLILYFLSAEMNGVYAVSSRFPTIINIVNSVFILSWQDFVISSDKQKDNKINSRLFDRFVNFEFSFILILISFSEITISFLVSAEFYESYKFMPILYVSAAYSAFSGYLAAAYIKEKQTKKIFTTSIISGLLNILISGLLIKYIGLYSSVLGSFVGFLLMFVLRVKSASHCLNIRINYVKITLLTLICIIFSVLIIYNSNIALLLILCSLLITFFLNKELILKVNRYGK